MPQYILLDSQFPVNVLDIVNLAVDKESKYYRLEIVNKKFSLVEIKEGEADSKIVKIVGKSILAGGKVQMNLRDGQNFLSSVKFSVGDSVVLVASLTIGHVLQARILTVA